MSILRRTVFYDIQSGIARFWDWARVTTTLGTMVEPFVPAARHAVGEDWEDFDPDDEIVRVDEIIASPLDTHQLVLSSGPDHLHGGHVLPRVGR